MIKRSYSMAERLASTIGSCVPRHLHVDIQPFLCRWAKIIGVDETAIHRRLAWEGLSIEDVHEALQLSERSGQSMTQTNKRCTGLWKENDKPDRCIDRGAAVPFEELLLPLVVNARNRIARRSLGVRMPMLAAPAHAKFERALLLRLSSLFGKTLGLEFAVFRAIDFPPSMGAREAYCAFVERHHSDSLATLFDCYPVLARLAGIAIQQWIDATAEMLQRLGEDARELAERFGTSPDLGSVIDLHPFLSDFHNGGRSVCTVTFSSGVRVVYKPKPIGMEESWNVLLNWINKEGGDLDLRTFVVIARGDYGWAEYIESRPPPPPAGRPLTPTA